MKILLEVLPLEKVKHADSDFTHVQESWLPTYQHCQNDGNYSDK
jgi:hypothetical protein